MSSSLIVHICQYACLDVEIGMRIIHRNIYFDESDTFYTNFLNVLKFKCLTYNKLGFSRDYWQNLVLSTLFKIHEDRP